jgi:hypothetical protein
MTIGTFFREETPSWQLANELQNAAKRTLANCHPILHHLNADTSWLLQLPRPLIAPFHRAYFNILIDPWFQGPQSDVANWFSQQWHTETSAVGSIAEVEQLILRIEDLCSNPTEIKQEPGTSVIDAIAISHEFTDHCHKETLLEAHPTVPVFASPEAAKLIRSWKHFRIVHETPVFSGKAFDWRTTSIEPLPQWVGISRLQKETDFIYYHSALLIAFDRSIGAEGGSGAKDSLDLDAPAECLCYTPHGIHQSAALPVAKASPPVRPLAFIHGLHDVRLSKAQQLNLGAHNGLATQRVLKAKYWLATHDEVKKGGGIVSWFLQRKIISVEEALEEEARRLEQDLPDGEMGLKPENTNFRVVGNGESIILE